MNFPVQPDMCGGNKENVQIYTEQPRAMPLMKMKACDVISVRLFGYAQTAPCAMRFISNIPSI